MGTSPIFLTKTLNKMLPACDNTTICKCEYNTHVSYNTCVCPTYLDPYHFCNQTIFEAYYGLDRIYPCLGLLIYLILLIMYMFEFVADVKRKQLSSLLVTKTTVIVFILSRLIIFPLWLVSSMQRTAAYANVTTFINSIGTIVLISALILTVIAWLDLALLARNLGDQDTRLQIIKFGLFIATGVIGPINILSVFLAKFVPETMILLILAVCLLILLMLGTIIVSVVYLTIILRWIREANKSDLLTKMRIKSYWIIALLGSLLLTIVILIIFQTLQRDTPQAFLGIEITGRIIETLMLIIMFGFLERTFISVTK